MHKGQTTEYFMHCFFVMPITVITDNQKEKKKFPTYT